MKLKIYDSNWLDIVKTAEAHCRTDDWKLVKIHVRYFGRGYVAVLKKKRR